MLLPPRVRRVAILVIILVTGVCFYESSLLKSYGRYFNQISHQSSSGTTSLEKPAVEQDLAPKKPAGKVTEPDGDLARLQEEHRRVPATLISLVRNSEQHDIVDSVVQIEASFNQKFNYPWTFFNDQEFTDEFKDAVRLATGGNCSFEHIDEKDWVEPEWIDKEKAKNLNQKMKDEDHVQYATTESYHRMCRWNSGNFFTHPALDKYKYYWRVEPKTKYYCDIDYDVFAYMQDNDKGYGFVINLYDSPESIKTLWPTVKEFFLEHPDYVVDNNALQWLTQESRPDHNSVANGYSTCHFWSNFEIGELDFFRGKEYQDFYNHLDQAGGFFYERWGDAPVHSVALALLMDKSRIHWFKDIGYFHSPYYNCPSSDKCKGCTPGRFTDFKEIEKENCMGEWLKAAGDG